MSIRRALPLVGMLAAAFVAWPRTTPVVFATEPTGFADADGDFLPDSVEWVALTSASNADTDGDTVEDFVEFVQAGRPRHAGPVVTGAGVARSRPAWLHDAGRRDGSPVAGSTM